MVQDSSVSRARIFQNIWMVDVAHVLTVDENFAAKYTKCKRKGVACRILARNNLEALPTVNQPPFDSSVCTNEKGNCGCEHAEMIRLRECPNPGVWLTTYSPCYNCALAVIKSDKCTGWVYRHLAEHHPRGIEIFSHTNIAIMSEKEYYDSLARRP